MSDAKERVTDVNKSRHEQASVPAGRPVDLGISNHMPGERCVCGEHLVQRYGLVDGEGFVHYPHIPCHRFADLADIARGAE